MMCKNNSCVSKVKWRAYYVLTLLTLLTDKNKEAYLGCVHMCMHDACMKLSFICKGERCKAVAA
jgi:hypothetical protein